jgi:hypothetical protein
MQLDLKEVEELSMTLHIRALKLLPRDIKQGFERLLGEEIASRCTSARLADDQRVVTTEPVEFSRVQPWQSLLQQAPAAAWD